MSRGKILVIRGGAIGDFVLTLPVLAALRQRFPEAGLEVLGYPHIAQLARAGGLADDVRSIEARSLAGFFARGAALDSGLCRYFGEFAVILSYLYDPDEVFQANVRQCSSAQFIAGPHRPDEKLRIHATEIFLRPLERLAIFGADPVPRLKVGPAAGPSSSDAGESTCSRVGGGPEASPTFALHPGSGSERKSWPEAKWAELLRHLVQATDWKLLLVGGESESERLVRLATLVPGSRLELARHRPLPELAARLSQCAGFVGHDSGISHLAAALGLPLLALWGETNESVWKPLGEQAQVLRHPAGLAGLAVEAVLEQIRTRWGPA